MAAKSPEPKGAARGQGLFAAIIAEATCYNYYMFHPICQTVWLPWIPHITVVTACFSFFGTDIGLGGDWCSYYNYS